MTRTRHVGTGKTHGHPRGPATAAASSPSSQCPRAGQFCDDRPRWREGRRALPLPHFPLGSWTGAPSRYLNFVRNRWVDLRLFGDSAIPRHLLCRTFCLSDPSSLMTPPPAPRPLSTPRYADAPTSALALLAVVTWVPSRGRRPDRRVPLCVETRRCARGALVFPPWEARLGVTLPTLYRSVDSVLGPELNPQGLGSRASTRTLQPREGVGSLLLGERRTLRGPATSAPWQDLSRVQGPLPPHRRPKGERKDGGRTPKPRVDFKGRKGGSGRNPAPPSEPRRFPSFPCVAREKRELSQFQTNPC